MTKMVMKQKEQEKEKEKKSFPLDAPLDEGHVHIST
jgi:hypothetical protein